MLFDGGGGGRSEGYNVKISNGKVRLDDASLQRSMTILLINIIRCKKLVTINNFYEGMHIHLTVA